MDSNVDLTGIEWELIRIFDGMGFLWKNQDFDGMGSDQNFQWDFQWDANVDLKEIEWDLPSGNLT